MYVTCNYGARDDFQVQLAIDGAGLLEQCFVEYNNRIIKYLNLPRKPVNINSLSMCLSVTLSDIISKSSKKIGRNNYYDWVFISQMLGELTSKYAIKNNLNVFSELYTANSSFKNVKNKKILFQTHPYAPSLRDLYSIVDEDEQFSKYPISTELEMINKYDSMLDDPAHNANSIFCASTFTKNTLTSNGIDCNIKVVPYGVDTNIFKKTIKTNENFSVVYIGQNASRKNISNLLLAWKKFDKSFSELHIIGKDFEPKIDGNIHFHGRLSTTSMVDIISSSSFLILPSYAEGFGLVLLQSLAVGTPVIANINSGFYDLNSNLQCGIEIYGFDSESILNSLVKSYDVFNSSNYNVLCNSSLENAHYFSWARFRQQISENI